VHVAHSAPRQAMYWQPCQVPTSSGVETNAGRAGHAGASLDGGHDALPLTPLELAKPTPTLPPPPGRPLPPLTLPPAPAAGGSLVLPLPALVPVAGGPLPLSSALPPGAEGPPPLLTPGPLGGCRGATPAPVMALAPAADPTCDAPPADAVPLIGTLGPGPPGCSSEPGVTRPPQAANRVKASPAIAVFIAEA
jgi:hypothetical protein